MPIPASGTACVRGGRTLATPRKKGAAPATLPGWIAAEGFSGLVKDGEDDEYVRGVAREADSFLVVQMPVDERLFADLQPMTIRFIASGGRMVIDDKRIDIKSDRRRQGENVEIQGVPFFSAIERYDWATGAELGRLQSSIPPTPTSPYGASRARTPPSSGCPSNNPDYASFDDSFDDGAFGRGCLR